MPLQLAQAVRVGHDGDDAPHSPLEVTLGEKKVMDKHQKTQNAVMSVVTNGNIMSNTVEMLRRLEWLNIEN